MRTENLPIPIAVIGANPEGRGGEWIRRIREDPSQWDLIAAVDPNPEVRAHWNAHGLHSAADLPTLLVECPPSAAVVAVPPVSAFEAACTCLRSGIGLIVEKPLGSSTAELVELQRLVSRLPRPVLIPGVQRRSHGTYQSLAHILAGTPPSNLAVTLSLGRSGSGSLTGHRSDPRQCRGGALLDLGYHALDLVHFLVGQPLDLISTHLQSDGDLGTALESSAWLFGRAGPAWVRISVDRGGSAKTEVVQARLQGGEMWTADRAKLIDSLGTIHHQTDPSWARAERACLGDLATAVRSSGAVAPPDLWSHLATLQTVEAAYSQSKILGWQPMERE